MIAHNALQVENNKQACVRLSGHIFIDKLLLFLTFMMFF